MSKTVIKVRCADCLKLIRKNVVLCSTCFTSVHDKCLKAFLDKSTTACCTRIFKLFYLNYFSVKTTSVSVNNYKSSNKRKHIDSELESHSTNKIRKTSSLSDINFDSDNSIVLSDSASTSELNMPTNDNNSNSDTRGGSGDAESGNTAILKAINDMKTEMGNKLDQVIACGSENKSEIVQLKYRVTDIEKTSSPTSSQLKISGIPEDLNLALDITVEKILSFLGLTNVKSVIFSIREIKKKTVIAESLSTNSQNSIAVTENASSAVTSSSFKQKTIFLTVTDQSIKNEILECKKNYGKLLIKEVFSDIPDIGRFKDAQVYINKVLERSKHFLLTKAKKFVKANNLHKAFIYDNLVNIQITSTGNRIPILSEKDLSDAIKMQE